MTPPPPRLLRKGSYVVKFTHCLRIVFVIEKYAYVFPVGGGATFLLCDLPRR